MTLFFDAFTRFGPKPRQHGKHPWTLQQLSDELDHCSISGALVASSACTLYDAMFENRRLVQLLEPFDHLFPLWNVMPHWTGECPEPAELSQLMRQHDVRAVTLYPNTNGWDLNSRTSKPLLDELERTGTLAILDLNDQVIAPQIEQLAQEHPGLPVLLHGVGWARQRSIVPLLINYNNLHIAFDFFQINYGIERLTDLGCEDQLVFASNAIDMCAGAHRFYVDYADVSDTVKTKVASGNLIRLLKGQAPPRERVNVSEDAIMREARLGKPLSPVVIDMHAHILDEGLNGAGGAYTMFDGGPSGTVRLAQRMGVDAIGLMSWNGTVGVHADDGNRCTRAALDAAPDSWWGLATFDPVHESAPQMRAKMEAIFQDPRFIGLKPYPQYGIPYDDARYDVWWEFGNERRLYCGLHPVKWFQAAEFESICARFPNLTVVAFHCGASYEIADTVISVAKKYPNFMAEITLTPVNAGIVDYLVEGCGADRVLYGSDLPMRDPRQQLGWVVYSKLSLEDKKKVLGLNAQRLIESIRAYNRELAGANRGG